MTNAERQRGSVTIEMVILFPVVLGLLFAAVQTGLWFHARNIALTSAQEGARVAAMYESSSAAGRAAAVDFATTAGGKNPRVTVASDATTTTVSVQVDAPNMVPWLIPVMPISQAATMPLERITG
jgi:Flp pilus assembly protein TadG